MSTRGVAEALNLVTSGRTRLALGVRSAVET